MVSTIEAWKAKRLFNGSEEQLWRTEAKRFRLPYWDWARVQEYTGNFAIPQVCTLTKVTVVMPGNSSTTLDNPLAGFTNPKQVNGQNIPMGDPAMGIYRIQDNGNLPVCILFVSDIDNTSNIFIF
jgi:hypothetical protein